MRIILLICGLLLALVALAAEAGMKAGPNMAGPGHHRLKSSGAPLLDGLSATSLAVSFRKLHSAYVGPALRIRRASDNAETDIGFLGVVWDEAAAAAHCAATNCFFRWLYDQSGAARDLGQATAANQPALIFNCNGTLPCLRMTTNTQTLTSAAYTPPSVLMSMSVVAKRAAATPACYFLRTASTGNRINASGSANTWSLSDGTLFTSPAAADGTWHSAQGVIKGAGSALTIDGVTAGATTITGTTGVGAFTNLGPASGSCDMAEAIYWPSYGLTAGEIAIVGSNQKTFWGTP